MRRGVPFEWANLMDALQAERDQNITIDTAQIRLRTLEDALSGAITVDDCWSAVRRASLDLGFQHLAMRLDHTFFEESFGAGEEPGGWTMHIPISENEFIQLGHVIQNGIQVLDHARHLVRRQFKVGQFGHTLHVFNRYVGGHALLFSGASRAGVQSIFDD